MSDDDKPLDLRDKLALEILNGLLAGDPTYCSKHSGAIKGVGASITFYNSLKNPRDQEEAKKKAEHLIRTSYMMADIMRKVRLTAFT